MTDQSSKPKRSYSSRRPGTNPRTGEPLVPWQEVQVLDPELPSWDFFTADVRIATDEGSRVQTFKVRACAVRLLPPESMALLAIVTAEDFGFTVVQS